MSFEQWQKQNKEPEGGFEAWQQDNAPAQPVGVGQVIKVAAKAIGGDIAKAVKETPTDIKIGTLNFGAGLLSSVKRRAVQLSGGGILPDDVVLSQYEPVRLDEQDRQEGGLLDQSGLDRIFKAPRVPGSIAAQAAGTVTRLPDIGSGILRGKAEKMQAEQDKVTLASAPITKLHRMVVQSGVPSMAAAVGISLMTGSPLAGLAVLGESEGGSAFQEQLDKGGSVRKSLIIADLSEAAEIGGEMLVLPKILKGFKEGVSIRKMFTIIAENATQEGITSFNQRFLEVFGTETSKGTDKKEAAKVAFKEGIKAIPEGAFVGGAIGAGASVVGEVSNAIVGKGGEGFIGKDDADDTGPTGPPTEPTGELAPEAQIQEQETLAEPSRAQQVVSELGDILPDPDGFRTMQFGDAREAITVAGEIADLAEQQGFEVEIKTDANKLSIKEITPTVGETVLETPFEREQNGRQRDEERRAELRVREELVETQQRPEEADATLEAEKGREVLETEPGAVVSPAKSQKALDTAQQLANQTGKTIYVKDGKVLVKKPAGESVAVGPEVEGVQEGVDFTSIDVINKGRRDLKAKIGAKKTEKYFNQADKLLNPNENNIVEYRENGIVTEKDGKFTFHALADLDQKKWRLGFTRDVSDQFKTGVKVSELKKAATRVSDPKKAVIKPERRQVAVAEQTQKEVADVIDTDFTQPSNLTSARQADIDATREDLGLDVIESQSKRGWKKAQKLAKTQNIARKADDIADEIIENPVDDMGDVRTAGLTQRMAELKKEHKQLTIAMKSAKNDADIATISVERERVLNKLDKLQRAVHLSGSEAGRRLVAQKLTLDENFDLASVLVEAKSKKGAELTKKQEVGFEKQTDKMDKMSKEIDKLIFEVAELKAKKFVKKGRTATQFKKMSKAQKDSELAALIAKTNNLIKEGCIR